MGLGVFEIDWRHHMTRVVAGFGRLRMTTSTFPLNQANNSTVIMDEETTSRDSFAATSPDTPSSPCVRIVLYSHLSY